MSDRSTPPPKEEVKEGEEVVEVVVDNSPGRQSSSSDDTADTSGESSTVTSRTETTTIVATEEHTIEAQSEVTPSTDDAEVAGLTSAVGALSTGRDNFSDAATVSISDSKSGPTRSDAPTSSSGGTVPPRFGASGNVQVRAPSVTSGSGSGSGSGERGAGHRPQKTIHGWEGQTFAPRPGVCKAGQDIKVVSNHYELEYPDEIEYHLYNIEMKVQGPRGALIQMKKREEMRPLFWNLVKQNQNVFGSIDNPTHLIYNDCNLLYTSTALRFDKGRGEQRFMLPLDESPRSKRAEIVIKSTGMQIAKPNSGLVEQQHGMVTLLDLILSQRVRCDLHSDSRKFVSHASSVFFIPNVNWDTNEYEGQAPPFKFFYNIGRGMAAMVGLHGAVKLNLQHHKILYNVDLASSVYHKHTHNLLAYIFELTKLNRSREFNPEDIQQFSMDRRKRATMEKQLTGISLRTSYLTQRGLRKRYTFCGLHNKNAISEMLQENLSVAAYYEEHYNIRLQFPQLPLVRIHKKKPIYIPMELLELSELPQKVKGQPPEEQLGCFIRETAFEPEKRKGMIEYLGGQTGRPDAESQSLRNDDPFMAAWGVGVIQKMQTVEAKILPRPQLEFPGNDIIDGPVEGEWIIADGRRNDFRKALIPPKRPVAFGLVYVNRVIGNPPGAQFFHFLMETLVEFGINVVQRDPVAILNWSTDDHDYDKILKDELKCFKTQCEGHALKPIPMVLFVFDRKEPYSYSEAKMISERECGVFSQGILVKNYMRLNGRHSVNSTAHNMFMKINGKLGGTHYRLAPEGSHRNWSKITNKKEPTLFLGVDVCHPGREEVKGGTSLAAVVGNIDIDCMQYRCSWRLQKTGEERIVSMTDEIQARIAAFAENTGVQPKHIVMYRDGVAENEFKKTLYEEKKSFDAAIKRISMDVEYQPTFTYIVCSKRHHTRFFATSPQDTYGPVGNLRPGVLVEQTVCTKDFFDFYILSHAGPLGTSRPTHYYVLHDDWAPSSAFWQTITYALCFTYIRTPKAVSLPAPVYYAHLAAKRGKVWLDAYDRLRSSEYRSKSEWEAATLRNDAANCSLDGMIFV